MRVRYNTAKLAKEKGFDLPCNGYYDVDNNYELGYNYCYRSEVQNSDLYIGCTVPIQSELQTWLRDIHKIQIEIDANWNPETTEIIGYTYVGYRTWSELVNMVFEKREIFETYEQALEVALLELLKSI